jgi:putative peptidoglycan lipid II flippase
MQLPLGVFGVAVGMVTLPAVSKVAAGGVTPEFGRLLSKGLRLVMLLTIPSAVGLIVLAEPVISLIYERGQFTADDSRMAGLALQTYALGLVFYSGIKVVQPAFYAIDRRFVPMTVSFIAIAVNVGLNAVFLFVLDKGHEFLALSTSCSAMVNFGLLFFFMRKFAGHLETPKLTATLAKLAVAAVLLGGVCWGARLTLFGGWSEMPFLQKVAYLFPTIGVAGGLFFAAAYFLRVDEVNDFLDILRRRLKRR